MVAVEDAGKNAVNVTAHVLVSLLSNGLCYGSLKALLRLSEFSLKAFLILSEGSL